MRRRLFWKILLAFWLTFFAITQGVWLCFEIQRERGTRPRSMAAATGPGLLAAASELVAESGPKGFAKLETTLPEELRGRLQLRSAYEPDPRDRALIREVVAPDGTHYTLRFSLTPPGRPGFFRFNTPPELLILGLLGGLPFSAMLAWYLIEPINRLRRGFDRLARGELNTRLMAGMGGRRDEIADLARDFDGMAQRLEQLVVARDRLLRDVSHELRSPLARLQIAIGLARQSPDRMGVSLDRIDREVGRLDMLVSELLALARAENGLDADEYFDLGGVVASVVDDARFEARSMGVAIELQEALPPDGTRPEIRGSAELVRRAIENIVRNALRFSSDGQGIDVALRYLPGRNLYRIDVADQGPGVAEQELETIFEPFVRGDHDMQGLGLGLAIARRAIGAHGGSISASNRAPSGLCVTVLLHPDRPVLSGTGQPCLADAGL